MERQISDRSLVNLLFKTIKEFYLKSENIVSDCKKYDRCRLISTLLSLDEKHEYIRIFCDDKKRKILSTQTSHITNTVHMRPAKGFRGNKKA